MSTESSTLTGEPSFSVSLPISILLDSDNVLTNLSLGQLAKLHNLGLTTLHISNDRTDLDINNIIPLLETVLPSARIEVHENFSSNTIAFESLDGRDDYSLNFLYNWLKNNMPPIEINDINSFSYFCENVPLLNKFSSVSQIDLFEHHEEETPANFIDDEARFLKGFMFKNTSSKTGFVVINTSESSHDLPLPSGFMAVAKITQWQSNVSQSRKFVSTQSMQIPPESVIISVLH